VAFGSEVRRVLRHLLGKVRENRQAIRRLLVDVARIALDSVFSVQSDSGLAERVALSDREALCATALP
jgi:hypothetical protein